MKVLDMMTSDDIKRIKEDRGSGDLTRRIEELENSITIALEVNDKYQRENVALKKRVEEAEGENTIIKGIGMNSPEMRACQERVKEAGRINKLHQELIEQLKAELARTKEDHQYDNLVHAEELRKVLKK